MTDNLLNDLKKDFVDKEPIMDSIYGIIKISPFEKRIISTKEMQRLRGIKQLGFVNLVYPNAEHSRFSHSLGVCHQAKRMISIINRNLEHNHRYKNWRVKFCKEEQNTAKHYKEITITPVEKIVISVAALLHDLSHSPFSHEIETPDINGKGIPNHDDFEKNPIFFKYLFNKNFSDIAKIIDIYNKPFVDLLNGDDKWKETLNNNSIKDGYVEIKKGGDILDGEVQEYEKLPLLGVMIFELLLFDKVDSWLKVDENGIVTPNREGITIKINETGDTIQWKYIEGWFRPYRKDIVANTICADLLDYLIRDGKNTGILPSLDLKFFDRMTITKAIPDKTNTLIPLKKIPDFCEHVVFDIYDHKRGVIRHSVITEIISFLQQRYLLAERVYNHRVVEGARSMLQEASFLFVENDKIDIYKLHDTNTSGGPINDDSFLAWVLNINSEEKKDIVKAQKLVSMIKNRRIYREIVIIDGILGSHKGSYRGTDVNCKTLADVLLNYDKRKNIIQKLEKKVRQYYEENNLNYPFDDKIQIFTIGVRRYGKRYKVPRVLVAKPITNLQVDDIETFPLFEGKKLPSIHNRLEAMQLAYNSLWKVYLFIHPFFHFKDFTKLHETISKKFLLLLYEYTNIEWENSIKNYDDLLPENPIDIPTFIDNFKKPIIDRDFIKKIIKIVNKKIPTQYKDYQLKSEDVENIINKINEKPTLIKKLQDKNKCSKIIDSFENHFSLNISENEKAAIVPKKDMIIAKIIDFIKEEKDGIF